MSPWQLAVDGQVAHGGIHPSREIEGKRNPPIIPLERTVAAALYVLRW